MGPRFLLCAVLTLLALASAAFTRFDAVITDGSAVEGMLHAAHFSRPIVLNVVLLVTTLICLIVGWVFLHILNDLDGPFWQIRGFWASFVITRFLFPLFIMWCSGSQGLALSYVQYVVMEVLLSLYSLLVIWAYHQGRTVPPTKPATRNIKVCRSCDVRVSRFGRHRRQRQLAIRRAERPRIRHGPGSLEDKTYRHHPLTSDCATNIVTRVGIARTRRLVKSLGNVSGLLRLRRYARLVQRQVFYTVPEPDKSKPYVPEVHVRDESLYSRDISVTPVQSLKKNRLRATEQVARLAGQVMNRTFTQKEDTQVTSEDPSFSPSQQRQSRSRIVKNRFVQRRRSVSPTPSRMHFVRHRAHSVGDGRRATLFGAMVLLGIAARHLPGASAAPIYGCVTYASFPTPEFVYTIATVCVLIAWFLCRSWYKGRLGRSVALDKAAAEVVRLRGEIQQLNEQREIQRAIQTATANDNFAHFQQLYACQQKADLLEGRINFLRTKVRTLEVRLKREKQQKRKPRARKVPQGVQSPEPLRPATWGRGRGRRSYIDSTAFAASVAAAFIPVAHSATVDIKLNLAYPVLRMTSAEICFWIFMHALVAAAAFCLSMCIFKIIEIYWESMRVETCRPSITADSSFWVVCLCIILVYCGVPLALVLYMPAVVAFVDITFDEEQAPLLDLPLPPPIRVEVDNPPPLPPRPLMRPHPRVMWLKLPHWSMHYAMLDYEARSLDPPHYFSKPWLEQFLDLSEEDQEIVLGIDTTLLVNGDEEEPKRFPGYFVLLRTLVAMETVYTPAAAILVAANLPGAHAQVGTFSYSVGKDVATTNAVSPFAWVAIGVGLLLCVLALVAALVVLIRLVRKCRSDQRTVGTMLAMAALIPQAQAYNMSVCGIQVHESRWDVKMSEISDATIPSMLRASETKRLMKNLGAGEMHIEFDLPLKRGVITAYTFNPLCGIALDEITPFLNSIPTEDLCYRVLVVHKDCDITTHLIVEDRIISCGLSCKAHAVFRSLLRGFVPTFSEYQNLVYHPLMFNTLTRVAVICLLFPLTRCGPWIVRVPFITAIIVLVLPGARGDLVVVKEESLTPSSPDFRDSCDQLSTDPRWDLFCQQCILGYPDQRCDYVRMKFDFFDGKVLVNRSEVLNWTAVNGESVSFYEESMVCVRTEDGLVDCGDLVRPFDITHGGNISFGFISREKVFYWYDDLVIILKSIESRHVYSWRRMYRDLIALYPRILDPSWDLLYPFYRMTVSLSVYGAGKLVRAAYLDFFPNETFCDNAKHFQEVWHWRIAVWIMAGFAMAAVLWIPLSVSALEHFWMMTLWQSNMLVGLFKVVLVGGVRLVFSVLPIVQCWLLSRLRYVGLRREKKFLEKPGSRAALGGQCFAKVNAQMLEHQSGYVRQTDLVQYSGFIRKAFEQDVDIKKMKTMIHSRDQDRDVALCIATNVFHTSDVVFPNLVAHQLDDCRHDYVARKPTYDQYVAGYDALTDQEKIDLCKMSAKKFVETVKIEFDGERDRTDFLEYQHKKTFTSGAEAHETKVFIDRNRFLCRAQTTVFLSVILLLALLSLVPCASGRVIEGTIKCPYGVIAGDVHNVTVGEHKYLIATSFNAVTVCHEQNKPLAVLDSQRKLLYSMDGSQAVLFDPCIQLEAATSYFRETSKFFFSYDDPSLPEGNGTEIRTILRKCYQGNYTHYQYVPIHVEAYRVIAQAVEVGVTYWWFWTLCFFVIPIILAGVFWIVDFYFGVWYRTIMIGLFPIRCFLWVLKVAYAVLRRIRPRSKMLVLSTSGATSVLVLPTNAMYWLLRKCYTATLCRQNKWVYGTLRSFVVLVVVSMAAGVYFLFFGYARGFTGAAMNFGLSQPEFNFSSLPDWYQYHGFFAWVGYCRSVITMSVLTASVIFYNWMYLQFMIFYTGGFVFSVSAAHMFIAPWSEIPLLMETGEPSSSFIFWVQIMLVFIGVTVATAFSRPYNRLRVLSSYLNRTGLCLKVELTGDESGEFDISVPLDINSLRPNRQTLTATTCGARLDAVIAKAAAEAVLIDDFCQSLSKTLGGRVHVMRRGSVAISRYILMVLFAIFYLQGWFCTVTLSYVYCSWYDCAGYSRGQMRVFLYGIMCWGIAMFCLLLLKLTQPITVKQLVDPIAKDIQACGVTTDLPCATRPKDQVYTLTITPAESGKPVNSDHNHAVFVVKGENRFLLTTYHAVGAFVKRRLPYVCNHNQFQKPETITCSDCLRFVKTVNELTEGDWDNIANGTFQPIHCETHMRSLNMANAKRIHVDCVAVKYSQRDFDKEFGSFGWQALKLHKFPYFGKIYQCTASAGGIERTHNCCVFDNSMIDTFSYWSAHPVGYCGSILRDGNRPVGMVMAMYETTNIRKAYRFSFLMTLLEDFDKVDAFNIQALTDGAMLDMSYFDQSFQGPKPGATLSTCGDKQQYADKRAVDFLCAQVHQNDVRVLFAEKHLVSPSDFRSSSFSVCDEFMKFCREHLTDVKAFSATYQNLHSANLAVMCAHATHSRGNKDQAIRILAGTEPVTKLTVHYGSELSDLTILKQYSEDAEACLKWACDKYVRNDELVCLIMDIAHGVTTKEEITAGKYWPTELKALCCKNSAIERSRQHFEEKARVEGGVRTAAVRFLTRLATSIGSKSKDAVPELKECGKRDQLSATQSQSTQVTFAPSVKFAQINDRVIGYSERDPSRQVYMSVDEYNGKLDSIDLASRYYHDRAELLNDILLSPSGDKTGLESAKHRLGQCETTQDTARSFDGILKSNPRWGARVVDLGCGKGTLSAHLDTNVLAVDCDGELIKQYPAKSSVQRVCGDFKTTPLRNTDIVICNPPFISARGVWPGEGWKERSHQLMAFMTRVSSDAGDAYWILPNTKTYQYIVKSLGRSLSGKVGRVHDLPAIALPQAEIFHEVESKQLPMICVHFCDVAAEQKDSGYPLSQLHVITKTDVKVDAVEQAHDLPSCDKQKVVVVGSTAVQKDLNRVSGLLKQSEVALASSERKIASLETEFAEFKKTCLGRIAAQELSSKLRMDDLTNRLETRRAEILGQKGVIDNHKAVIDESSRQLGLMAAKVGQLTKAGDNTKLELQEIHVRVDEVDCSINAAKAEIKTCGGASVMAGVDNTTTDARLKNVEQSTLRLDTTFQELIDVHKRRPMPPTCAVAGCHYSVIVEGGRCTAHTHEFKCPDCPTFTYTSRPAGFCSACGRANPDVTMPAIPSRIAPSTSVSSEVDTKAPLDTLTSCGSKTQLPAVSPHSGVALKSISKEAKKVDDVCVQYAIQGQCAFGDSCNQFGTHAPVCTGHLFSGCTDDNCKFTHIPKCLTVLGYCLPSLFNRCKETGCFNGKHPVECHEWEVHGRCSCNKNDLRTSHFTARICEKYSLREGYLARHTYNVAGKALPEFFAACTCDKKHSFCQCPGIMSGACATCHKTQFREYDIKFKFEPKVERGLRTACATRTLSPVPESQTEAEFNRELSVAYRDAVTARVAGSSEPLAPVVEDQPSTSLECEPSTSTFESGRISPPSGSDSSSDGGFEVKTRKTRVKLPGKPTKTNVKKVAESCHFCEAVVNLRSPRPLELFTIRGKQFCKNKQCEMFDEHNACKCCGHFEGNSVDGYCSEGCQKQRNLISKRRRCVVSGCDDLQTLSNEHGLILCEKHSKDIPLVDSEGPIAGREVFSAAYDLFIKKNPTWMGNDTTLKYVKSLFPVGLEDIYEKSCSAGSAAKQAAGQMYANLRKQKHVLFTDIGKWNYSGDDGEDINWEAHFWVTLETYLRSRKIADFRRFVESVSNFSAQDMRQIVKKAKVYMTLRQHWSNENKAGSKKFSTLPCPPFAFHQ